MSILHVFIINPNAGKNTDISQLTRSINAASEGEKVKTIITNSAKEAQIAVKQIALSYNGEVHFYACGGDGTLNSVISEAYKYKNCAVGIVPVGSGNDFVRSFENIPKKQFLAIKSNLNGAVIPIDLISIDGKISVNCVTIGFDCAVAKKMSDFKELPFVKGSLAYIISLIYCLFSKMKHSFSITADNSSLKNKTGTYLLSVFGKGKYYGGGFKAMPLAELSNGYMELIYVDEMSRMKFLQLVRLYKNGKHINHPKMPMVHYKRCQSIKLESDCDIDINIDGEIYPLKNPEAVILPRAAKFIVPAAVEGLPEEGGKKEQPKRIACQAAVQNNYNSKSN